MTINRQTRLLALEGYHIIYAININTLSLVDCAGVDLGFIAITWCLHTNAFPKGSSPNHQSELLFHT